MTQLSKGKFKYYRTLKQKKYRHREQKYFIEGVNLCKEAFAAGVEIELFLYCPRLVDDDITAFFLYQCRKRNIEFAQITPEMLSSISDTVHSQGVVCILPYKHPEIKLDKLKLVVVLDAIQEPGNAGTIIRTADWFGADCIIAGKGTVEITNPKVLRASMGSTFHLPVVPGNPETALPDLKARGMTVYAAFADKGKNIHRVTFRDRCVLLIGNEANGIRSSLTQYIDVMITIPGRGAAESLNAAIACGIILNQMTGQK